MALYRGSCKLAGLGKVPGTTYVTEAEYNNLPSSKLTDGVNYGIYEDGTDNTITKFIQNGCEYCLGGGGPSIGTVDMLVIAGGGAGGYSCKNPWNYCVYGGGGGAGGTIYQTCYPVASGTYDITIGSGGVVGTGYACGGSSCALGIITYGGGSGQTGNPQSGGSGAGGGRTGGGSTYASCGAAGTEGQGYAGGDGTSASITGGGGGAGGAGNLCIGGIGISSDISGTTQCYAFGGDGLGGSGSTCNYCGSGGYYGEDGKPGIVIIRYPNNGKMVAVGGCRYECDGYMIHCYPANGTFTVY